MIAILGAGISGLSLGYFLKKKGIPFRLLEADERSGGYITTIKEKDYLLELGPNSLLADQEIKEILAEINLTDAIQYPEAVSKKRFIFKDGKYRPLSPPALLFSSFFSWNAKLSVWRERNRPKGHFSEETVAQFFERRFCREIVDMAINPFVSGIYAGDPEQLLIEKTFPSLVEHEQQFGSVVRGMMKGSGAARKESFSFQQGMQALPDAFSKVVPVEYGHKAESLCKVATGWEIETNRDRFVVEKVVVCIPAHHTGQLLANTDGKLSEDLLKVNYPAMYVVHSAYERNKVGHPLDGFGGLNPKKSGLFTAGNLWSSSLFPNRCPKNQVLFTSFVGGMLSPQLASLPPQEVKSNVAQELAQLFHIQAQPVFQKATFWKEAIPQYDRNIVPVHDKLELWEKQGLFCSANWTAGGVSVADCLKKSKSLAFRLA